MSTLYPQPEDAWQLTTATAPWFGDCAGSCDRELGRPKPEVAAKRITDTDDYEWFCVSCLVELIKADATREAEQYLAALTVQCPICRVKPEQPCNAPRLARGLPHQARRQGRSQSEPGTLRETTPKST